MYRIIFNPFKCVWEIQLLRYWLIWITLRGKTFDNFYDAEAYTCMIGLDNVYRRRNRTLLDHIAQGESHVEETQVQ